MTDIPLFMQGGWRNIWKQKTIWLFSALSILSQLVLHYDNRGEQNLAVLCLSLIITLVGFILWVISAIGVPYLAYSFSIGKSATVQESLLAVKKFAGRIIGVSCLGFLLLLPCGFLTLAIALRDSARPPMISSTAILVSLPLSIFYSLWGFSIFGFFENDWSIRKSIESAWMLFSAHFGTLAILGVLLTAIYRVGFTISGILTVLLQSGFDVVALSELNYIDPYQALSKSILFALINGANQTAYNAFGASTIVLAYLQYRGVNVPQVAKSS